MKELKHITDKLLQATSFDEIEISGSSLYDFFENTNKVVLNNEDSYTKHGVALSPLRAVNCMLEYSRTVKFIQGVKNALDTLPIKTITYAGCGAYAPLLLSILHYYSKKQFKITLVDINTQSIDIVKDLIVKLGYSDYSIQIKQGDAAEMQLPKTDLLICECMAAGLYGETQVGIMKNIKFKNVVPEEIQLSVSDYDIDNRKDYSKEEELCVINKNNLNVTGGVFDTSQTRLKLCIHTRVKIFKDILLDRNESTITSSFVVYKSDTYTKLSFREKPMPKWIGEKVYKIN